MEQLLISRREAAEALGVSVDTLDWLCIVKGIRRVKIGSRVLFSPEELRSFVKKEGRLC